MVYNEIRRLNGNVFVYLAICVVYNKLRTWLDLAKNTKVLVDKFWLDYCKSQTIKLENVKKIILTLLKKNEKLFKQNTFDFSERSTY